MTISFRLNEDDEKLIRQYAKMHGMSLSELFRQSVMERIEDEFDLMMLREAVAEYEADPVTYSHEEVAKMIDLD